jgi:hypothetical protein
MRRLEDLVKGKDAQLNKLNIYSSYCRWSLMRRLEDPVEDKGRQLDKLNIYPS